MGTDIDGWIEYQNVLVDDEIWMPALQLEVVYPVGRDYAVFGYLFGVRNSVVQPLAARRGLPADLSPEVRQDATRCAGFFAHSWVRYNELKHSGWQWDRHWEPLMSVLATLACLYGEEHVRLVVWFEN